MAQSEVDWVPPPRAIIREADEEADILTETQDRCFSRLRLRGDSIANFC
jgi:hypothetical protein